MVKVKRVLFIVYNCPHIVVSYVVKWFSVIFFIILGFPSEKLSVAVTNLTQITSF